MDRVAAKPWGRSEIHDPANQLEHVAGREASVTSNDDYLLGCQTPEYNRVIDDHKEPCRPVTHDG